MVLERCVCRRAGAGATMLKLRAGPSPYQTAVAMVGARAGRSRAHDRRRRGGSGGRMSRSSRASPAARPSSADHAPGAAARVEAAVRRAARSSNSPTRRRRLPFDPDTFDVVVLDQRLSVIPEADRLAAATEAIRVAAPRRPHRRHRSADRKTGSSRAVSRPRPVMPAADVASDPRPRPDRKATRRARGSGRGGVCGRARGADNQRRVRLRTSERTCHSGFEVRLNLRLDLSEARQVPPAVDRDRLARDPA